MKKRLTFTTKLKTINMKKITLFAFALVAISFASCKKTHTCQCINSGTSGQVTATYSLPAQTSSDAKTTCSSYASTNETCTIQ